MGICFAFVIAGLGAAHVALPVFEQILLVVVVLDLEPKILASIVVQAFTNTLSSAFMPCWSSDRAVYTIEFVVAHTLAIIPAPSSLSGVSI